MPEPADILTALTSHHLLDRIEGPTVNYRFEHQQFQEFYAALALSDALAGLPQDDLALTDDFVSRYINDPAWEEPVCMVAEDLEPYQPTPRRETCSLQERCVLIPYSPRHLPALSDLPSERKCGQNLASACGPSIPRQIVNTANWRSRPCSPPALTNSLTSSFRCLRIQIKVRHATYRAVEISSLEPGPENAQIFVWTEELRTEFVSELMLHHRKPSRNGICADGPK